MRRLIAVAALAALLAGGCGIPDDSDVTIVGDGPSGGTSVGDGGVPPQQHTRESANDPVTLVQYYLQAAAGDEQGALARVKAFLSPKASAAFKPGPDVRVVRQTEPLLNPGFPDITLIAQQVGTLKSNGVLEPIADPNPVATRFKLEVGNVKGEEGLFITGTPPQMMMLSDDALNTYYQRCTIYFWNNSYTALVPDVRYMPRSVPAVQQPTMILSWLANGPASWLADAVQSMQPGASAPENVPAITNDTLEVTLTAQAVPPSDDKMLDRLRRQLQWSLRPLLPRTLALKIGHDEPVNYSDNDYWTSNPSYRLANAPERFVVYGGVIRRLTDSSHPTDPVPVLKPADNKGITTAAMSASATHTFVAVVAGKRLRVAAAPTGTQGDLVDVTGLSGTLGRPLWAITADGDKAGAVGLITANGRLYSFGPQGGRAQRVQWQVDPGPIASVSVAPDAYRMAVVTTGGKLYRTTLNSGGDGLTVDAPQQLLPPTFRTMTAAAWSSEGWLTVAGVRADDDRISIMDVSVDGVLQTQRLPDIGDKTVSYLTAYPDSPISNPNANREVSDFVSYTAAGTAWDALSTAVPITTADLVGPVVNPPAGATPTAPFFLD